jgi:hypothetical protein
MNISGYERKGFDPLFPGCWTHCHEFYCCDEAGTKYSKSYRVIITTLPGLPNFGCSKKDKKWFFVFPALFFPLLF